MDISFGKTAYVAGVGDKMLDAIEKYEGFNASLTGDGMLLYEFDELEDAMNDRETDDGLEEVEVFLIEAVKKVREQFPDDCIGDIVFVS